MLRDTHTRRLRVLLSGRGNLLYTFLGLREGRPWEARDWSSIQALKRGLLSLFYFITSTYYVFPFNICNNMLVEENPTYSRLHTSWVITKEFTYRDARFNICNRRRCKKIMARYILVPLLYRSTNNEFVYLNTPWEMATKDYHPSFVCRALFIGCRQTPPRQPGLRETLVTVWRCWWRWVSKLF